MFLLACAVLVAVLAAVLMKLSAKDVPGIPMRAGTERFWGITRVVAKRIVLGDEITAPEFHVEGFRKNDWKPFAMSGLGGMQVVLLIDPADYRYMMRDKFLNFVKGSQLHRMFEPLLGDGIFAVDGQQWKQQRIVASHMFNRRQLRERMSTVFGVHAQQLTRLLAEAAPAGPVDVQRFFYHFTFDCINSIAFNRHVDSLSGNQQDCAFQDAFDRCAKSILKRVLTPWWPVQKLLQCSQAERDLTQSAAVLDAYVYAVVDDYIDERGCVRSQSVADDQTLTGLFLQDAAGATAMAQHGLKRFTRDLILNFVIAGRDTTGTALTSCIEYLSQPENAHWQDALGKEAAACFQGSHDEPLTFDDIEGRSPVAEAVFMEALRLHPSVPANKKMCVETTTFPSGITVPAGAWCGWVPLAMNRNPSFWGDNADAFDPSRFLRDGGKTVTQEYDDYVYPTFNAGPRLCLGKNMAILEGKIALLTLFARLRFAKVDGFVPKLVNSITWQLDTAGLQVHVFPAEQAATN